MLEKAAYFQELKRFSLFNTHFVFLDSEDYLADGLFIKHQVRVYFGDEFMKPGSPYCVIFCHVRRRDVERFHTAVSELPNKMLLYGNVDYLNVCAHMWQEMRNARNKREDSCGADGTAEQA